MYDILKRIAKCNLLIQKNSEAADIAQSLPFYKLFLRDQEQKKDIESFRNEVKINLDQKYLLLESLQQSIELEKVNVANQLKELTLIKISEHEKI